MFTHIVFWRLKDSAHGQGKTENALAIKQKFEALRGAIPGLVRVDLGIDVVHGDDSWDIALYTEFESRAAYDAYYPHPAHKEIVAFVREARTARCTVDYDQSA